jgi:Universal stress protein family
MKTQFADSTKVVEFVPHILDLKRILVPVDFSETSKKAFLYALKFAEQFNCEITLLHVVQPMTPMVGAPLAVEPFFGVEDEFSVAERSLSLLTAIPVGDICASAAQRSVSCVPRRVPCWWSARRSTSSFSKFGEVR